jgi:hypothetical protein
MRPIFARSILMAAVIVAGAWQAALAASPFAREVPTTYADFDEKTGSLTLVVADVVATDYLKGYGCPEPTPNMHGPAADLVQGTRAGARRRRGRR